MGLERVPELAPPAESPSKGGRHKDKQPGHEDRNHRELGRPEDVLAIPASAVLDSGLDQVAFRRTQGKAYELVRLKLGPRAEGLDDPGAPTAYYPVLDGLVEGDEVVVRGGFLLDSQRQIEGMPSLLYPEGRAAQAPAAEKQPAVPQSPMTGHRH
jgi:hypothetical protein